MLAVNTDFECISFECIFIGASVRDENAKPEM